MLSCATMTRMKRADALPKQDATTLAAIFRTPTKPVKFSLVKSLLESLGFKMQQGRGSRVKFINSAEHLTIMLHAPHPGNELCKDAVRQVRDFLQSIGVMP